METAKFKVGDILVDKNGMRQRVICIQKGIAVLCMMDTDKLVLAEHSVSAVSKMIEEMDLSITASNSRVYETERLPFDLKKKYLNYLSAINAVNAVYGPDYIRLSGKQAKPEITRIMEECNIARSTLWRIIRRYLQGGFDVTAIIDKRTDSMHAISEYKAKTGRSAENGIAMGIIANRKVKREFQEALNYYKTGRLKTYEDAYDFLCMKHYSHYETSLDGQIKVLNAISARPTFRQFYYYCTNNITKEEIDAIKTSRQEQRNNKRLLLSDNLNGIQGPWDCFEMDEVEVDLSLVSVDNPAKVVGRPIVYVMVDVYTRLIAAVSVAFDNNSVLGFTNCLMNLADDKVEYCQKYGLTIDENLWPSGYLPKRIRCDRGAEYRSKRVHQICNELGINLQFVTAGTGSLKGSVEQFFHMMHSAQNPDLEKKGVIQKRFDSQHHQNAMLNINDFTKILLNYIITYNQYYFKDYPITRDMRQNDVRPIPLELWQYGTSLYGMPMPISNKSHFYYALLTPISARISRKGITYNGLYYINYNDNTMLHKMYTCGTKREPFECRMDERDISSIYYLRDGELVSATLNKEKTGNGEYEGLTYLEYKALKQEKQRMDSCGKEDNRQLRVARKELNKTVIDGVAEHAKAVELSEHDTEEIRKNRRLEQQAISNANSVDTHTAIAASEDMSQHCDLNDFETDIDKDDWKSAIALFDV